MTRPLQRMPNHRRARDDVAEPPGRRSTDDVLDAGERARGLRAARASHCGPTPRPRGRHVRPRSVPWGSSEHIRALKGMDTSSAQGGLCGDDGVTQQVARNLAGGTKNGVCSTNYREHGPVAVECDPLHVLERRRSHAPHCGGLSRTCLEASSRGRDRRARCIIRLGRAGELDFPGEPDRANAPSGAVTGAPAGAISAPPKKTALPAR